MWLLAVLVVAGARAHNPSRDMALEPFVIDGTIRGTWTTAGLVEVEGLAWLEVCGSGMPFLTDATLTPDGRFLRAGGDELEESVNGGCSWTTRSDVPLPRGLARLGDRYVATTADPTFGVYVSNDGGDSFAPAAPFPRALTATGIAADAAGAWWVTAEGDPPAVLTSPDGGESWEEIPVPPTTGIVVRTPRGPGPHGGMLLTVATFFASTTVWEWTGTDWALLVTLPLTANAVACIGPTCLATLSDIALVRWDGDVGPSSLELLNGGPVGCLVAADDGLVWGCNARGTIALFSKTTDGFTFETSLAGEVIAKRICPDGTAGADICPLPPAPPRDTGFPVDTDAAAGDDDDDPLEVQGGCCATAGAPPGAVAWPSAFALALVALRKLRRTPRTLAR